VLGCSGAPTTGGGSQIIGGKLGSGGFRPNLTPDSQIPTSSMRVASYDEEPVPVAFMVACHTFISRDSRVE